MIEPPKKPQKTNIISFPNEVLDKIISFIKSNKDRNSASLVCKEWYNSEKWSRNNIFIGNCYAITPEIVIKRFLNIKSVIIKGKPRFHDFNLVPENWGANINPWLICFSKKYPFLEELRLKRMSISDESLEFLGLNFSNFKRISLLSCDGFSTDGLAAIATHCKNLVELDIQENDIEDRSGNWLSCFPENFTSLEILNFSHLHSEVNFSSLERLVARCKSLRTLKVNKNITLEQLQRLLVHTPKLAHLGTGAFSEELNISQYASLESVLKSFRNLQTISCLCDANSVYLPVLYPSCSTLTFLNLNGAPLHCVELAQFLVQCPNLCRLWVMDTVGDKGLEAVGSSCPLLKELRVFPARPFEAEIENGVTESGFVSVSYGCPRLRYVLYFCRQMTNAAVATIVENCPEFTHFRLCIMNPGQPDHLTNEPMDEAFGYVVKGCKKLRRLAVSGLLTDLTFEYIGKYAKELETLSVAFAGNSDMGMQCVLSGCLKLRRLEIRDCPFGNTALLSGLERYESMRSLWMSACNVTLSACQLLAKEKPRLNVEVINDEDADDCHANKVYVYRSVAGPRKDAPSFVLTL